MHTKHILLAIMGMQKTTTATALLGALNGFPPIAADNAAEFYFYTRLKYKSGIHPDYQV